MEVNFLGVGNCLSQAGQKDPSFTSVCLSAGAVVGVGLVEGAARQTRGVVAKADSVEPGCQVGVGFGVGVRRGGSYGRLDKDEVVAGFHAVEIDAAASKGVGQGDISLG